MIKIISKNTIIQREQLEVVLDQLVPQEHLVRKLGAAALDFSFIYDLEEDVYSEVGRPSNDPVFWSNSLSFNTLMISL